MSTRTRTPNKEASTESEKNAKNLAELAELQKPVKAAEFGGPFGTFFLTFALPVVIYWLWASMEYNHGYLLRPSTFSVAGFKQFFEELYAFVRLGAWPTWKAAFIYFTWFFFQAFLQAVLPGRIVLGAPLPGGYRLKYKLNGWLSWWMTLSIIAFVWFVFDLPLTILYDNYGPMLTVVNLFSFAFTLFLKFHAKLKNEEERMSGWFFYDYWMGFARNPRIGDFDLKLFCEARPGLILWVLLNFSIAAKQYALYGFVSYSTMLVCAFHFWYVADYYYHEEYILTTMDIITEKFGFMLVFGDLAWVPFTYCFQAYYLLKHTINGQPIQISFYYIAFILALKALGFYFFRWVNSQKHEFRRNVDSNPSYTIWGKKPTYILTKRGTKLLTSGWWGVARHLNYTGDMLLSWVWCLPCKFDSLAPYFYGIYFTSLDLHRCWRDHNECLKKYGEDWEKYCKIVPYVFIPYVF
eukprot:TRINITY_DN785_c0_g1_i1.p1 TRINITY_DN785_c0_g1~~TRINITY_DN785_c0_g1_i1.p1  ORF type:complete len:465 (-),score=71.62 TRINITY_DN785_c0_g1_i1:121-1515(-)